MVTRPDFVPAPLAQAANNPPYPLTPTSEHPPSLPNADHAPAAAPSKPSDPPDDHNHGTDSEWDSSDDDDHESLGGDRPHTPPDVPASLKIQRPGSRETENGKDGLPSALRAGPPGGHPIPTITQATEASPTQPLSQHSSSPPGRDPSPFQSNNPYLRMQAAQTGDSVQSGVSNYSREDVASANAHPVELPTQNTPVELMAEMDLKDRKQRQDSSAQPPLISVTGENQVMGKGPESGEIAANHSYEAAQTGTSPYSSTGNPWADSIPPPPPVPGPPQVQPPAQPATQAPGPPPASILPPAAAPPLSWEQNDEEARKQIISATSAQVDQEYRNRIIETTKPATAEEVPPTLPPRGSQDVEHPPPMPPRPGPSSQPADAAAAEAAREQQRKEHYQIKHVNWVDATGAARRSPILTQNANGPCPLLALVNALVLTTPANEATALVESLRTREQVSLGLLLDAVFDELMSGRRGGAAQELPDVSDLYSFLVTLHTGMNVNPRFGKPPKPMNIMDADPSEALPTPPAQLGPGDFEETREMRLYSTFNIPLIHGWMPPPGSPELAAFMRAARTYEDAQNVQFREEELVEKLSGPGLTAEEQQLFQDVITIKDFFDRWPTQLTDHGLNVIQSGMQPGQISILFRNDHFLTVYKEPRSGRLFTLVTDAGYAGHQEIVWETLVDVTGQGSELYAGDFRVVGPIASQRPANDQQERPLRSLLDVGEDDAGWTAVSGRASRNQRSTSQQPQADQSSQAPLSAAEQEDHDLALALQLQEEEEDRQRREQQRQREEELSRQYLSSDTRSPRSPTAPPAIPPRRSAAQQRASGLRNNESELPPPTYEQAAQGQPFNPPQGHPANPSAPLPGSGPSPPGAGRGSFVAQAPGLGRGGRRPMGRMSAGQPHAASTEERERCVMM